MTSDHSSSASWAVRVDTGGTFTDGWALDPDGREYRCKVLSSSIIRLQVDEVLGGGCYRLAGGHEIADNFLRGF